MGEKYDGQLGEILSDLGHAVSFLDCVFGFLYRRTDFYRPEDGPPASHEDIEKVVLGIFRKWQERTETELVSYSGDDLPVAQEYEVADDSLSSGNRRILKAVSRKKKAGSVERSEMAIDTPSSSVDIDSEMTDVSMTVNVVSSSDEVCSSQDEMGSLVDNVGSSTDETGCSGSGSSEDKCLGAPGVEAAAVSSSECYNGAVRDNYRWSQTITDLDVQVIVGPSVQKDSTDVRASVTSNTVRVETRDKGNEWKTVVDGELCWPVNREECIWSLVPGQYVQIHLEKAKERWWEALLKSEPKIDLTQIDASRPMDELSEEEHMKIEELMWNEQRKMKGLPTSQDLGLSSMLKDAWDKEGSPFNGRPYDPSLLNFAGVTGGTSTTTFIAQSTAPKLRTKSVQLPARIRTRPAGSIIIPMTPNQVSPTTNTNQAANNIQTTQLKQTTQTGKPFVAIKPDNSTVSRMVTINTASAPHSNSSLSEIRTAPTTVITKNISKPLQTVHISAQSSNISKAVGGKPNVILVQKPSGSTLSRSITLPHGGKEIVGKVLVGKSGMPPGSHSSVLSLVKSPHIVHSAAQQSANLSTTAAHGNVIVLDLSQEQLNKNSTLSDILRVSGIIPEDASASETIPTEAVEEGHKHITYELRKRTAKRYREDSSSDDDYLFCDACNRKWFGDCPPHGQLTYAMDTQEARRADNQGAGRRRRRHRGRRGRRAGRARRRAVRARQNPQNITVVVNSVQGAKSCVSVEQNAPIIINIR